MKISILARVSVSLLLIISMFAPTAILAAGDGKKHFKEGMRQETSEQWDKAAEEFALAVSENPKNPEYRLHLQRALFNASQMYMKRGAAAAKEGDYEGGYNAFRKAYGFDPTNELARAEMDRMVRLKQAVKDGVNPGKKDAEGNTNYVQTGYNGPKASDPQIPRRVETLRDLPFPSGVNLQFIVKELAKDLDLNVLFDRQSNLDSRMVKIELHQVTPAKALDYIFLQESLFFQKVGPRTIIVADNNQRQKFQQLVLRTFYLANANPKDVQTVIQSAIPAQPGRSQTIVLKDDATNSITVRDTSENIALIGKLISSLDKDRAEVVMDVAIYEVNKSDLLQFGNQLGLAPSGSNPGTLGNLGGVGFPFLHGGSSQPITGGLPFSGTDVLSIAFGLPVSSIAALQTKNNTKLIASTQIHAFNNEDSSARIGQRVPVKSASFVTSGTTSNNGVVSDVVNYEQVGLTLKFKPLIFPNQDVQVAMEIESKDVAASTDPFIPVFTERTIKGTARVQNNKTLLLASVAQNNETNGRSGLPLLGLIPILGRLFTAPTRDNRQVDIVIAVTPRVIRAPSILPEDEIERPTGTIAMPTNANLEAMVEEEDRLEFLASARRLPTSASVQLPDQKVDAPNYVRTGAAPADAQNVSSTAVPSSNGDKSTPSVISNLRPIDSSAQNVQLNRTSDTSASTQDAVADNKPTAPATNASADAEIKLPTTFAAMKTGEKVKIPILVSSSAGFRSAVFGIKFDDKNLAVRSVTYGDVFGGTLAGSAASPFLNSDGKMYVSLSLADGITPVQAGVLAYIEVEALADGVPSIVLDRDVVNLLTGDGKNFALKF